MLKIAWIFDIVDSTVSGGIKTIIDLINNTPFDHYLHCKDNIKGLEAYGHIKAKIVQGYQPIDNYDIAIATYYKTAYVDLNAKHRAYFIQDVENHFFPMSFEHMQAQTSYKLSHTQITMGKQLQTLFNAPYFIDFCVDKNAYKKLHLETTNSVCFLHQPEKPWRCTEIGLQGLQIFKKNNPDTNVYLYGSDHFLDKVDISKFINLGKLSVQDCNALYNVCDVGMCFSLTNISRIPFEMASSGLNVVDIKPNTFDTPKQMLNIAKFTPYEVALTISRVMLLPRSNFDIHDISVAYNQFTTIINTIAEV